MLKIQWLFVNAFAPKPISNNVRPLSWVTLENLRTYLVLRGLYSLVLGARNQLIHPPEKRFVGGRMMIQSTKKQVSGLLECSLLAFVTSMRQIGEVWRPLISSSRNRTRERAYA